MTISSQDNPQAAWSLFLFQRQQLLNNHLARVTVNPNHQGTHGLRDEVISSVGAQDMDTSGYQVSADMDDVEFHWENDLLDVDAAIWPGIDFLFSPTAFDDLEMGGSAENTLSARRRGRRELSSSKKTSLPETYKTPELLRSCPFGTRIEKVPEFVYRNLFQEVLPCLCFNIIYN